MENILILRRFRSDKGGTFGTLEVEGVMFFTVERPWEDNLPFVSCIPEGDYTLAPHNSKKYGDVLCLVGDGVTQNKEPDSKRYACLIHTANYPYDVEGCIGLGDNYIADKNMVTNSRQSIIDFYDIVSPNKAHELKIENAEYIKG